MSKIAFIFSMLVAVLFLVACPADNTTPCEETGTCPPPGDCLNSSQAALLSSTLQPLQTPTISLETTLKAPDSGEEYPVYCQGDDFDGSMTLTLNDPDEVYDEAVVFLNVVKCISKTAPFCRNVEQIDIRKVFDENNSSFTPDINKKLYVGAAVDDLRDGVTTILDAKLVGSVAVGTYSLVVQVFNCRQTDPEKVGVECGQKRIGNPRSYRFQVTK